MPRDETLVAGSGNARQEFGARTNARGIVRARVVSGVGVVLNFGISVWSVAAQRWHYAVITTSLLVLACYFVSRPDTYFDHRHKARSKGHVHLGTILAPVVVFGLSRVAAPWLGILVGSSMFIVLDHRDFIRSNRAEEHSHESQ